MASSYNGSGISYCHHEGTDSQQETLSFIQTRVLWLSSDYSKLAGGCGERICDCFLDKPLGRVSLHDRFQAYYAALSYRMVNGEFPILDDCMEYLVPSHYILRESEITRRAGNDSLANVMHEFAYHVDFGWEDQRERGLSAYKQGWLYLQLGDHQSAERAFQKAIESLQQANRANYELTVSTMSLSYLYLADIDAVNGNWEEAIQEYRLSIQSSPRVAQRSFRKLVNIWQQRGYDEDYMLWQFEEMRINLGVDDPYLTSGPTFAFLSAGMVDSARLFLNSAPQQVGSAAVVLRAHGMLCETVGEMDCARHYYTIALSSTLIETEPRAAEELAADLARVNKALGNTWEAISFMDLAIRLNPDSPSYWYQLAQLYSQVGEIEKARRTLEDGLDLHPDNDKLRDALDELIGTDQ